MGTRHLTVVKCDGEYKIAQYGQWDGYPDGAGIEVLEFAYLIQDPYNRNLFREKVRKLRFPTPEEAVKIADELNQYRDWERRFPQYSRNTGAKILDLVLDGELSIVGNSLDFAFDHVMCEYIWGIDLDRNVVGLYIGCDDKKTLEPEIVFPLDDLPTKKDFLDAFQEEE